MKNQTYRYRPVRFYVTAFIFTWLFWFAAAYIVRHGGDEGTGMALMLLGLIVPSVTAMFTVLLSGSKALKRDLRNKLIGLFRVKPSNVIISIAVFFVIIVVSILLSTLFGQSLNQFAVADFSFSAGGSALLTIILAALFEELGWRGYAEDSIAAYCSWVKESVVFGLVWGLWHMPLFLIPDTYHYNILAQSPWFMVNFFVSVMPIGFLFTWVYVKNHRSILACMIFHFFVNFLQEKIAMTQTTKCVETVVLFIAAAIVVAYNRDMFFETRHVGNLLGEKEKKIT
ncbi:MAG: CPBP family intramembrane metalloprotease [Oscillospiraceae bacterium]|jgi:membrane protease YdiL (CAAX protease family)|nr:CPBP family intramembrane metalloprotease [Oscillospiraceae bacterium]